MSDNNEKPLTTPPLLTNYPGIRIVGSTKLHHANSLPER